MIPDAAALTTRDAERVFVHLWATCMPSLERCLFSFSDRFQTGLLGVFRCWFELREPPGVSGVALIPVCGSRTLRPAPWLTLSFGWWFLCCRGVFWFDVVLLVDFCFCCLLLAFFFFFFDPLNPLN